MATSASHTPITLSAGKLEPLVREETANCTQLGVQLSIPLPRLKDLEQQSRDKKPVKKCFQDMCYQWLHNDQDEDVDRKWSEVYKALEEQGNRRLKVNLEKKYAADTRVELDLGNFTKELKEMTPKWYTFGVALGLSTTDLNIIEDEKGSQRYMITMLEEWMNNQEATWEALQEALRHIGNRRLAAKLKEHKLKDKQERSESPAALKKPKLSTYQEESTAAYAQSGPAASSLAFVGSPTAIVKPIMIEEVTRKSLNPAKSTSNPTYVTKTVETDGQEYTCQVFFKAYNKGDRYEVKLIFAFSKFHLSASVASYFSDKRRGKTADFDFESLEVTIQPSLFHGWRTIDGDQRVMSKRSVDAYTGEGIPPHRVTILETDRKMSGGNSLVMEVRLDGTHPLVKIDINILVTDDICESDSDTESD